MIEVERGRAVDEDTPVRVRTASVVLALLAAVAGQWLFDVGSRRVALVLFAVAAIALVGSLGSTSPSRWREFPQPRPVGRPVAVALGAAVATSLVAASVFDVEQPHVSFWWLHVGSMVVAVGAVVLWRRHRPARRPPASPTEAEPPLSPVGVAALAVAIGTLSLVYRVYELTSLPEGFWFDEAAHVDVARRIADEGHRPLWEGGSFAAPAHHAYLIAGALKLGAGAVLSARSISVLFGLLAIAGAGLLGRELWGQVGALAAMTFVGLSRWPVTVSRVGMFNVMTPACLLLGLGLVAAGLRRDQLALKLLGGMTLGLGVGFHSSMVPALLGAAVFLVGLTYWHRPVQRSLWVPLAGVVIVAAPIAGVALRDYDLYTERLSEVSLFESDADDQLDAAGSNARSVLGMFTVAGDQNGRHNIPGEPLLDPAAGGLLVLGLASAAFILDRGVALGLVGWGLLTLLPGVLTLPSEAPNALRVIGAMPVVFLLATGVLVAAVRAGPRWFAPVTLGVLVVASASWTAKDYFHDWREDPRVWAAHSTGETIAARTAAQAGDDQRVHAIGDFLFSPVGGLLAPGAFDEEILPDEVYPLALRGDMDAIVIVGPRNRSLVAEHGRVFGQAAIEEKRRGAEVGATVIRLPAEAVRARQGLTASYWTGDRAGAPDITRRERDPGGAAGELPVPLPAEARWEGLLLVETPGPHAFHLEGASETVVIIDGTTVDPDRVRLETGPHHFVVTGRLAGPAPAEIRWQPPGAPRARIPAQNLWLTDGDPAGLWGEAFSGIAGTGSPSRGRLDASIDFTLGQPDAPRPRLLRWTGYLDVSEDGLHLLGVETAGDSRLSVDGRDIDQPSETMHLTAGVHRLSLEVVDNGPATHVRLYWAPPGEMVETVPSTALAPPWTLSPEDLAALVAAEPAFVTLEPERLDVGVARPTAVAAAGDTVTVAGAGGEVWIRRGQADDVRVDLGHEVSDIGVGPRGEVLALDPAGRLVAVSEDSDPIVLATDPMLGGARGMDVDPQGGVLVAATARNRLVALTPGGNVGTVEQPASVAQPTDVAALGDGRVVTVDAEPFRVRLLDGAAPLWTVPLQPTVTSAAPHVARLGDRLFVTDPVGGQILELDLVGTIVATYRLQVAGQRVHPVGIGASEDGVIVVADPVHDLVVSFRPET